MSGLMANVFKGFSTRHNPDTLFFSCDSASESESVRMADDHHALEEGNQLKLDFSKLAKVAATGAQVMPVVAQHADTGEVLIVAYVNDVALETAIQRQQAVFWSTSRNELWIKGATSGDTLDLVEILVNCEQNSLLYRVRPAGEGACHTQDSEGKARAGCYYRRLETDGKLSHR